MHSSLGESTTAERSTWKDKSPPKKRGQLDVGCGFKPTVTIQSREQGGCYQPPLPTQKGMLVT